MHGAHDVVQGMRSGHGKYLGVGLLDDIAFGTETAGDDHLAVFIEGLADAVEGFGDGVVDEAAGIDHHQVGAFVTGYDVITLGAQLSQDQFGIDQGLGATQADEADFGSVFCHDVIYIRVNY